MRFIDDDGVLACGQDPDLFRNEREFLKGRDDNWGRVLEGLRKLVRVLIDLDHDSLLVLELINCVLELLIEHAAISNDDDRIKDALVVGSVKACESMGQPGDGIAFA